MTDTDRLALSIVIPLYNEAENVAPLAEEIRGALSPLGVAYEVEIKWYYNAGADNQMLYKGRVNCLKSHTTEA